MLTSSRSKVTLEEPPAEPLNRRNAPPPGATGDEFRLHGDLGLCAGLLRNALIASLHRKGSFVTPGQRGSPGYYLGK